MAAATATPKRPVNRRNMRHTSAAGGRSRHWHAARAGDRIRWTPCRGTSPDVPAFPCTTHDARLPATGAIVVGHRWCEDAPAHARAASRRGPRWLCPVSAARTVRCPPAPPGPRPAAWEAARRASVTEIGTVLGGRYRLVELLGQGGMATIYRAHDNQLDRDVAAKLLRPEYGRDPEFGSRFRQEAQSAASLNHPNIVSVYDYGQDAGRAVHRHGAGRGRGPRLDHPPLRRPSAAPGRPDRRRGGARPRGGPRRGASSTAT